MADIKRASQKIDSLFDDFLDKVYQDVQVDLGLSLEETITAINELWGPVNDIAEAYDNWYASGEE